MLADGNPVHQTIPAAAAFGAIAATYDDVFSNSFIGRAQRASVWREAHRAFRAGQHILELNCGTGVDALHLAGRGVAVTACDGAPEMIARARQRIDAAGAGARVRLHCLPTEAIAELAADGLYDGAFSNFSGLNCVADLHPVARDLARLVRPGGQAVLCLFGKFCAWEIVWHLAGGRWRKAFRRLGRQAVAAAVDGGAAVTVRYPSVRALARIFSPHFRLERWIGVGVALPPSYGAPLAARFPRIVQCAAAIDPWLGACPGMRSLADHVALTFRRR